MQPLFKAGWLCNRAPFSGPCRYIVKQLQGTERKSFLEIAPAYFRYLAQAMRKNMPTCLAKITGVYTVRCLYLLHNHLGCLPESAVHHKIRTIHPSSQRLLKTIIFSKCGSGHPLAAALAKGIKQAIPVQVVMRGGGGKETSMDILVMENVFYDAQLFPIYDLKGSERARLARDDPSDPSRVLMDQNLVQANLSSPILARCCCCTPTFLSCFFLRLVPSASPQKTSML